MRAPLLFASSLFVLLAGPSWADGCAGAGDQASLNACAARQLEGADRSLNEVYGAVLARTDEGGKASLRKAESRWIAFRDAQCDFETRGSIGGSVHPFVRSLCLADLTRAQAARLDRQAHCEEGDLSCSR